MSADDLARFIAERLHEHERGAAQFRNRAGVVRRWRADDSGGKVRDGGPPDFDVMSESDTNITARHIARHDPAHVLAFVAAGRAILDLHRPQMFEQAHGTEYNLDPPFDCVVCWDDQRDTTALWPCPTVRAFGTIWAGHPAWREEWGT